MTGRGTLFLAVVGLVGLGSAGCVPDWATDNSTPYIMEIAGIRGNNGVPILSDVSFPVVNDEAQVTVNLFRKNNNGLMDTSAVEHVYLKRYEVRYFRTDGRNQEGVDVPYRITGPLGNVRLHTPAPGGEQSTDVSITIVRHQAKIESPLKNLQGGVLGDTDLGVLPQQGILTTIAEVTIHGETVQGKALQATGQVQVTFADFPDGN